MQKNNKYVTTMKGQGYLESCDRIRKIKTWKLIRLLFNPEILPGFYSC
jgi:hypothetical protein